MQQVRATFDTRSVEIFDRLLAGGTVNTVAEDYRTTAQAVHKVKQRIRNRLKELIAAQVKDEDDVDGNAGKR